VSGGAKIEVTFFGEERNIGEKIMGTKFLGSCTGGVDGGCNKN
jgi:hypothetical protein